MRLLGITGIYHANGGILGELSYVALKLFRVGHCSLCDITHTLAWKKKEWQACEVGFNVPFKLLHLNERDAATADFTDGNTPCVIAETDNGKVMLLTNHQLDAIQGDVAVFDAALRKAIEQI